MSVYCPDMNVAFIHVPKNAGVSIRKALRNTTRTISFDDIDVRHRTEREPAFANHFPVWRIQKLLEETKSQIPFDTMYKIMVVRNPWERMVSLYFHRMRKLHLTYEGKPRNDQASIVCAEKGFKEWLLHTPSSMDGVLTTLAQSCWGKDRNGVFCVRALRQENLENEWFLGMPLPKLNTGTGEARQYRDHYDKKTRAHVATHFAEDIERWGFSF